MKEITAVIERVKNFPYFSDLTPYEINNGVCDQFADECQRILQEEYEIGAYADSHDMDSDLFGHVWITYNERYYDAECPEGVDSPSDLPLFKNKRKALD